MNVNKSAQVVLTGYDKPKIDKTIKSLIEYTKKINVEIVNSQTEISAKSKLWGCEKDNLEQKILFLNGTMDDLRKILYAKTEDGIYLQLLLK